MKDTTKTEVCENPTTETPEPVLFQGEPLTRRDVDLIQVGATAVANMMASAVMVVRTPGGPMQMAIPVQLCSKVAQGAVVASEIICGTAEAYANELPEFKAKCVAAIDHLAGGIADEANRLARAEMEAQKAKSGIVTSATEGDVRNEAMRSQGMENATNLFGKGPGKGKKG